MALSEEQTKRYSRHLVMKALGAAGQEKLQKAKVLVIGAGGLGSPAALHLAAAGVGTIGIADGETAFGTLLRNTPQGVFGITRQGWKGEPIPVASFEEVHRGAAFIRSTVSGDKAEDYSVEILRIYREDRADGRNFLIKVVDPTLLSATGGIVQGMSGSPIIQDGKLVGAVTHVLVNDPTRGYGIFIENMLDAAG